MLDVYELLPSTVLLVEVIVANSLHLLGDWYVTLVRNYNLHQEL